MGRLTFNITMTQENNSPEIRNYYHIPITSVISPDLIFSVLVYQWYSNNIYIYYHPPGARDRAPCTTRGPRTASCSHGPVYGYNCFRPQATMSLSDYSELHGGRLGALAGKSMNLTFINGWVKARDTIYIM